MTRRPLSSRKTSGADKDAAEGRQFSLALRVNELLDDVPIKNEKMLRINRVNSALSLRSFSCLRK